MGAIKGYSAGYYVLTPSKFLHEFKSDDDFRKEPMPELSLYLPDCSIGVLDGDKFTVKGKDASKGRVGSAFALSHEFTFKAHSTIDAENWWNAIRTAAGAGAMTSDKPAESVPTSPVDSRSDTSTLPPTYRSRNDEGMQRTPLQTEGDYTQSGGGQQQYPNPDGNTGVVGKDAHGLGPSGNNNANDYAEPQTAAAPNMGGIPSSTTATQGPHSGVERAPGQY